ncbi:hypothetical protein BJV82DRAFT_592815 [Fennellomyces sp. T-0311]|nr:hypothetical protein BJV82DRAFT_592815 [Fennellomyces sp. T-0311]
MSNSVFDPSVDPLFDDWLVQDALDSPSSSPCIKQEEAPTCSSPACAEPLALSYPSPGLSSTSSSPQSTSSVVASPEQHIQDLFGGLATNPLTAALAALMSAAAVQQIPKSRPVMDQPPISAPKVTKRKRASESDTPLSPQDEAAIKRQKNTDAARRSRLKKVLKMEALETRVSELEKVNSNLVLRVAVLDSEKSGLRSKESSYEQRIKMLESQLAEAHKALANRSA